MSPCVLPTLPIIFFAGGSAYGYAGRWTGASKSMTASADCAQIRLHFRAADAYDVLAGTGTVTVSRPGQPDRAIEVDGTPNA